MYRALLPKTVNLAVVKKPKNKQQQKNQVNCTKAYNFSCPKNKKLI